MGPSQDPGSTFAKAAEALIHDTLVAGIRLELAVRPPEDAFPNTRLYEAFIDGHRAAALEIPFESRVQLLVALAEFVQEVMIETLWHAWPECPLHGDPLVPAVLADTLSLVWVCERDEGITIPVGSLRGPGTGPSRSG